MRKLLVICLLSCLSTLLLSQATIQAADKNDVDPALTYDVVAKDPAKYVGKRVTWPALATTGSGTEAAVASNPDANDARKYKMYAVRFASEKDLQDFFFAGKVQITGVVAGTLEISYEVSGPGGEGKEKRKEKVPLIEKPSISKVK